MDIPTADDETVRLLLRDGEQGRDVFGEMLSVTIDRKSMRKAHFDSFAETRFESMTFASILRQVDDGKGNLDGTKDIMGSIRSAIYDHDDVADILRRTEDDIPERRGIVICRYNSTDHNIVTCEKRIVVSSPLAS